VAYAGFLAAVVIGLGVAWNFLAVASAEGVKSFARESAPKIETGRMTPVDLNMPRPNLRVPRAAPKAANKGGD
jgi:hypothetical protein